ncbi:MAG: protein kinase [Lentisphaerae bacterium]|jgi:serine/threonine protein kinase|nr:protein kinase [Lentisphaerota bacterium]
MDSFGDGRTLGPDYSVRNSGYTLQEGSSFGQYRIVHPLGRGGMGEVYEAEHQVLHRRYALKLLPPDFASRTGALERFQREAEVMANLEHPNILKVDEFGETGGRYWLRMELAVGIEADDKLTRSLADLVEVRGGKVPQAEFTAVLRQVLGGLAHAHELGAIHRDLKPANILLTPEGPKIADFGLVRLVGEEWVHSQAQISVQRSLSLGEQQTEAPGTSGTSARPLLGTYEYMSPEQKRGEQADERSDIYALGLMSYRLLTGQKELSFELPSQIDPEVVEGWDEIVRRCLRPKPEDRPRDCTWLLEHVAQVEQQIPGVARRQREEAERRRKKPSSDVKPVPKPVNGPERVQVEGDETYLVYSDGIIRDTSTNLEWYVLDDENVDYPTAEKQVSQLSIGGGGWRVPTADEIRTLFRYGAGPRNMSPFFKTTGWWVWSCERHSGPHNKILRFRGGTVGKYQRDTAACRAFAVRSNEPEPDRSERLIITL